MATSAKGVLPEPALKAKGKGKPVVLGPPPVVALASVPAAQDTAWHLGFGVVSRASHVRLKRPR